MWDNSYMAHSSSEYQQVLAKWAAQVLPADLGSTGILDVRVGLSPGGRWSEHTADDASLHITVDYLDATGLPRRWVIHDDVAPTVTGLLRELLVLAELIATPPTLTAADPEPPEGAVVRDQAGHCWSNQGPGWFDQQSPQPWTFHPWSHVAGEHGPVTVLRVRSGHL